MITNLLNALSVIRPGNNAHDASNDNAHESDSISRLLFGSGQANDVTQRDARRRTCASSLSARCFNYYDEGAPDLISKACEADTVRLLVAQDEIGCSPRTVLLDSASRDSPKSKEQDGRKSPGRPVDVGDAARTCKKGLATDASGDTSHLLRKAGQSSDRSVRAKTRQSVETMNAYLDCMFGNTAMGNRVSTTKLHLFPPEAGVASAPITLDEALKTKAQKALVAVQAMHVNNSTTKSPDTHLRRGTSSWPSGDRRSDSVEPFHVMVTRTFSVAKTLLTDPPVVLPDSSRRDSDPFLPGILPSSRQAGHSDIDRVRYASPTSRKSPTYAVALIIKLRVTPETSLVQNRRIGDFQNYSSVLRNYQDRLSPWTLPTSALANGLTIPEDPSQLDNEDVRRHFSDVSAQLDAVLLHYDSISRTLTALQEVMQQDILERIYKTDMIPLGSPTDSYRRRLHSQRAIIDASATTKRTFELPLGFSSADRDLRELSSASLTRVARNLQIPRVLTGQGRWQQWGEALFSLTQSMNTKDQNFFIFTLLSAFLSEHMDWLQVITPPRSRRIRQSADSTLRQSEGIILTNRTVVTCRNRGLAQCLIFLLSEFLPQSVAFNNGGNLLNQDMAFGTSNSGDEVLTKDYDDISSPYSNSATEKAIPRKRMYTLLIPGGDNTPQFSADSRDLRQIRCESRGKFDDAAIQAHTGREGRGASVTSMAIDAPPFYYSANSSHTGSDLSSNSRWGSLKSFWSLRDRNQSLTDHSDSMTSNEGHGLRTGAYLSSISSDNHEAGRKSRARSSNEDNKASTISKHDIFMNDTGSTTPQASSALQTSLRREENNLSAQGSKAHIFPPVSALTLLVCEDGKEVEVGIDLPPILVPTKSSPASNGDDRSKSTENENYSRTASLWSDKTIGKSTPQFAAGWLRKYHPDFVLQATVPYDELEEDIKQSMKQEIYDPSTYDKSLADDSDQGAWVTVGSCLIADVDTFALKRIRLRRYLQQSPKKTASSMFGVKQNLDDGRDDPRYSSTTVPGDGLVPEERFETEEIADFDGDLADALEEILADYDKQHALKQAGPAPSSQARPEDLTMRIKGILLHALGRSFRTILSDRQTRDKAGATACMKDTDGHDSRKTATGPLGESTFREAIREWLKTVDSQSRHD